MKISEISSIGLMTIIFLAGILIGAILTAEFLDSRSKFCPECGRHYMTVQYCAYDGMELREIQR